MAYFTFTNHSNPAWGTLNWSTTSEVNCYAFGVQSKIPFPYVMMWVRIQGVVLAHGTTDTTNTYSFDDYYYNTHRYRLEVFRSAAAVDSNQVDTLIYPDGNEDATGIVSEKTTPTQFNLEQNYPNPFNPSTRINYSLKNEQMVTLRIINSLGQVVQTLVNERQTSGEHTITFSGSSLPSGVYFYRLETPQFTQTKRMILLK